MNVQKFLKRLFDTVVAVFALTILSPVLILVGLAVLMMMGRPLLFRQVRPGYRGEPIEILKFRTMRNLSGPDGLPLPDRDRMTWLGTLLRRTSLDELPQFWNILRGDLSLVGPRPLLMAYLPLYTSEQARRHEVRPGITGWAQVHGRNTLSWEDKFRYDVWYVDNWSLWLDIKIIAMTVVKVISGDGVRGQTDVTQVPFNECGPHKPNS